jgi:hypothetical protein
MRDHGGSRWGSAKLADTAHRPSRSGICPSRLSETLLLVLMKIVLLGGEKLKHPQTVPVQRIYEKWVKSNCGPFCPPCRSQRYTARVAGGTTVVASTLFWRTASVEI